MLGARVARWYSGRWPCRALSRWAARFLAKKRRAVYNRTALTVARRASSMQASWAAERVSLGHPAPERKGNPHETANSDAGAGGCRTPDRLGARAGRRPAAAVRRRRPGCAPVGRRALPDLERPAALDPRRGDGRGDQRATRRASRSTPGWPRRARRQASAARRSRRRASATTAPKHGRRKATQPQAATTTMTTTTTTTTAADDDSELSDEIPISGRHRRSTTRSSGRLARPSRSRRDATPSASCASRSPDDDEIVEDSKNAGHARPVPVHHRDPRRCRRGNGKIIGTVREGGKMNQAGDRRSELSGSR